MCVCVVVGYGLFILFILLFGVVVAFAVLFKSLYVMDIFVCYVDQISKRIIIQRHLKPLFLLIMSECSQLFVGFNTADAQSREPKKKNTA